MGEKKADVMAASMAALKALSMAGKTGGELAVTKGG